MDNLPINIFGEADPQMAHIAGGAWAEAGLPLSPERWTQIHRQWLDAVVQVDRPGALVILTAAQCFDLGAEMMGVGGPGLEYFVGQYKSLSQGLEQYINFYIDGRRNSGGRVYLGPLRWVEDRVQGRAVYIPNNLGLCVIVPHNEERSRDVITDNINAQIPNPPMPVEGDPAVAEGQVDVADVQPVLQQVAQPIVRAISIPMPRNPYLLYRTYRQRFLRVEVPGITNNEVSSRAGQEWHHVNQRPWQEMADADAKKHRELFPDYEKAHAKLANPTPGDVAALQA
ncbi:hypothetical protein GGR57DRAFT_517009 [Xylariaceae sp. FL1272]|nr:hypothetical protein GGR57DRAFT_517009 [Xylariaceae sp. FL1272]